MLTEALDMRSKLHLIEWISVINCMDEEEKRDLQNRTSNEIEHLYNMSLLLIEDEINLK